MLKSAVLLLAISCLSISGTLAQVDIKNPQTADDYRARAEDHEKNKRIQEALADFRKSAELDPQNFDVHFAISHLCADRKDYRGAIEAIAACLKVRPKSYSALFNRGLYYEYLGEFDDAIESFGQALSEGSDFSFLVASKEKSRAAAYHYRGRIYQWYKQDSLKAVADYTEALRLDPEIRMVNYRRGIAFHELKEYQKAQEDYTVASRLEPEYHNLLNAWAWQLATCPDEKYRDGPRAVEMATKTQHLETLAAALAESGKYEEAIATQNRAIIQLYRGSQTDDKASVERRLTQRKGMQARLKLYQAGQPFHE